VARGVDGCGCQGDAGRSPARNDGALVARPATDTSGEIGTSGAHQQQCGNQASSNAATRKVAVTPIRRAPSAASSASSRMATIHCPASATRAATSADATPVWPATSSTIWARSSSASSPVATLRAMIRPTSSRLRCTAREVAGCSARKERVGEIAGEGIGAFLGHDASCRTGSSASRLGRAHDAAGQHESTHQRADRPDREPIAAVTHSHLVVGRCAAAPASPASPAGALATRREARDPNPEQAEPGGDREPEKRNAFARQGRGDAETDRRAEARQHERPGSGQRSTSEDRSPIDIATAFERDICRDCTGRARQQHIGRDDGFPCPVKSSDRSPDAEQRQDRQNDNDESDQLDYAVHRRRLSLPSDARQAARRAPWFPGRRKKDRQRLVSIRFSTASS